MNPVKLFVLGLLCVVASGCAAITNPLANAIPVCNVPPELLCAPSRSAMVTVPLTLLRQKPPGGLPPGRQRRPGRLHRGRLAGQRRRASRSSNPPVYFPAQLDPMARGLPAALGFPINVREDGTIALPLVRSDSRRRHVDRRGRHRPSATPISAARSSVRGRQRIIVTLMQPRTTRVTVIRQENGGFTSGPGGYVATSSKRGSGNIVNLRAYENDVLSALAETGGLASLEDYSEVIVFKHGPTTPLVEASLQVAAARKEARRAIFSMCPQTIVIPTRILPGQPMPFRPQDILLDEGDVVFLEARDREVFYTGGLLPATEQILPRDYDLDVVTAVMKVQGSLINGGYSVGVNGGAVVQPGLGNPSPSLLTVVRRTCDGGQVAIARRSESGPGRSRERIRVLPGDVLILQETPGEAIARYVTQIFKFNFVSEVIKTSTTTATTTAIVP